MAPNSIKCHARTPNNGRAGDILPFCPSFQVSPSSPPSSAGLLQSRPGRPSAVQASRRWPLFLAHKPSAPFLPLVALSSAEEALVNISCGPLCPPARRWMGSTGSGVCSRGAEADGSVKDSWAAGDRVGWLTLDPRLRPARHRLRSKTWRDYSTSSQLNTISRVGLTATFWVLWHIVSGKWCNTSIVAYGSFDRPNLNWLCM